MADFHYDYFTEKFPNAVLTFTDTDSLCYHIQTDDIYKDISEDVHEMFDTSNFPKDHKAALEFGFPTGVNKKVVGMFKDECGGKQMVEFVGLRPKEYAYRMDGEGKRRDTLKCKGVTRSVVERDLTVDSYRECLYGGASVNVNMSVLRSHNHTMYAETVRKTALCPLDNKRYICDDKVSTLAWGHYRIPKKDSLVPPQ